LEDRTTPSIFFVTNTNDSGAGSLRQAVIDANNQVSPSPDTILFQTSGTIVLTSGEILIDDPVNITGPGSGKLIISGNNASRIFYIGNDALTSIHVGLSGMTLVGGNAFNGSGGAIATENEDLQLTDVVVSGNRAQRGGGIMIGIDGRLTMDRSVVTGNTAAGIGGPSSQEGTISYGLGGGLYLDGNSVTIIRDSTITGNSVSNGHGGGIYVDYYSHLLIQRSYLAFNNAFGGFSSGGGIQSFSVGILTILDSTIANNFATGNGGGINAANFEFQMVNSTVSGNTANNSGGGIHLDGYYYGGGSRPDGGQPIGNSSAVIIASTIANNNAGYYGGGIYSLRDVAISNSIISGNTADTDDDLSNYYFDFSLNFSLVQNKGGANIINGAGNIFDVAALLGPLTDNGGPTPTHQLLCGSPGIHAGNNAFGDLSFDQRGFPRIAGAGQDMGAVEVEFGWVRGTVFNDLNGNGVQDAGEAGLGNVFVWLDANGNRSPDNEEVFGRTNPDGSYELRALPGVYNVLHALPAGLRQTAADPGVAFVSAGDIESPFNFALQPIPGLKAFADAGFSPLAISGIVNDYRSDLGVLNPNVAGTQNNGAGRREINWDGVPDGFAAPNNLPADFFNVNSKRGVVFSTQGTGFQVSSRVVEGDAILSNQALFGNLNHSYPDIFQTFSPQRLFTPLGSTVHDVTFFVPGTNIPATVLGFGAVFVENDNPVQSSLEFFDINGKSMGVFLVPRPEPNRQTPAFGLQGNNGSESNNGLSFLGINFTDGRRAARVRIVTGNAVIGANDNNLSHDVVVLDDFIYGEPVAAVVPPPEPGPVVKISAIGSGPGGNSRVNVYNTAGQQIAGFNAFDISFRGEVHVATADIDGDGFEDVITAAGPGGGPHVQVWSGKKLIQGGIAERIVSPLGSFFTFDPRFQGGVFVAAGDVNGDGRQDIICAAGPGGGPHVIAFSGADATVLTSFYAYDVGFMGGVSVAAGDFTGDGRSDIATGAGPGGGPHVRIFDANNGNSIFKEFFAYDPGFRGGVYVGAGDLNGDNRADIVTGAGMGGGPHVIARDGQSLNIITQFFAYEAAFLGGVRVAVADWNNDGLMDILTGAGPGGGPHFRAVSRTGTQLDSFYALFDKDFSGGIFVG
jgi:hypothetical protein